MINTKRIWQLFDQLKEKNKAPSLLSYRYCVAASVIDNDLSKAISVLDMIRNLTVQGFDMKSWTAVANLCSFNTCYNSEDAKLRREIAEKKIVN